ncbi:MAG: Holliday junction resolvase RuvX [Dehalococcoidia bacterium]
MRIIALDVGERRIGVAFGDTALQVAIPAAVIERQGTEADWQAVVREAGAREAELIVAGMPFSLNGRRGPQAEATEDFIHRLREYTGIPIETWDERFSTSEAEHRMRTARPASKRGKAGRSPRGAVDAAAAAIILQSYLDALPKGPAT